MQTPPILFDLARTEQLTGRLLASAQHFRAYVALAEHPKITKEMREKARAFLAEVDARIGHVVIDAPAESILSVDGKDVTGTEVDVTPGPHTISARFGEQHGYVTLTAPPGVRTPAHVTFDVAQAGPAVPAVVPPPPEPSPERGATSRGVSTTGTVVRWGLSGLAVVGIGMGIGFAVDSQAKASDAQSFQLSHPGGCGPASAATCGQVSQLQSDQGRSSTIAWVSYGVGAAAALGAVAAWVFWPKETNASGSVSLVPTISPSIAGVQLRGRF